MAHVLSIDTSFASIRCCLLMKTSSKSCRGTFLYTSIEKSFPTDAIGFVDICNDRIPHSRNK